MQGNRRRAWRLRGKHNDDSEKENGVKQKPAKILNQRGFRLVGAARFELATTCTPCRYATRLRYAPSAAILTLAVAQGPRAARALSLRDRRPRPQSAARCAPARAGLRGSASCRGGCAPR